MSAAFSFMKYLSTTFSKLNVAIHLLVLILALSACGAIGLLDRPATDFPIPEQTDWVDYGPIFERGSLGEWDYLLWGGFTNVAVKKDGTFYLYYQGARGYRLQPDETVTGRSIGLATSPDGINFTKADENPVVTWAPTANGEEGAVSGGVLDHNGEILLYYGANTASSPTSVHADGRLATSPDGIHFADEGIVLDHADGSIWGSGDELFPILAIHDIGQWIVYYLPNGRGVGRKLGVAWGTEREALENSAAGRSGISTIGAWGTAGKGRLDAETYAIFLNDVTNRRTEVRTVSLSAPDQLSDPLQTYQFEDYSQATVLLDEQTNTWFMYYRNQDSSEYGVKLAPYGDPDTTPPTPPVDVTATPLSDRQIELTWSPAADSETGIVQYKVFRDNQSVDTVTGWSYTDTGLVERTEYRYKVIAVNYHGVEGPYSTPVTATTLSDATPPRLVSVSASGASDQVVVIFDEPVEQASAESTFNYAIDGGVSVLDASLNPDQRTIVLATSPLEHGRTYHLTVNNVRDRAETPNVIVPETQSRVTHSSAAGLVGAWNFDEGSGQTAYDTSNFGNDGALIYTDRPGPSWTVDGCESVLLFDGVDDQVTVDGSGSLVDVTDGSHTLEAWVKADSAPPNTTANDSSYSIFVREYAGLYYDQDRRFRGEILLADGSKKAIKSGIFEPDSWHHLVMAVDDLSKRLHLYVDGEEVDGSPLIYGGALSDHGDAPYFIGASEPLTNLYEYRFSGEIDDVRIYDRALGPTQIELLSEW